MTIRKTELHMHTKMSRMRGLISPRELVEYAVSNKYKAIAVTDLWSVQAFPEVYRTWQKCYKEYEERYEKLCDTTRENLFLKIVYGLELYLNDDLKKMMTPVLLYVKNEEGRRNLYKLVSLADRNEQTGSMSIDISVLQENRDGLLVGAVCDRGVLSDLIRYGETEEEILETAGFYDFIEITPYCVYEQQDGSDKGIYKTSAKQSAELSKLYSIGKRLNIPVIMTSDAYYISEEDKICYDILLDTLRKGKKGSKRPKHIKNNSEIMHTISQMSHTDNEDSMSDIEDYLNESTDRVLDMIEHVVPLREGRCYPTYPDADRLLREMCYQKAHKLYGAELPREVQHRLVREIDAICHNDFSSIYMIWHDLAKKSLDDGYLAGSRGGVGSSLVAYLLGITMNNPLDAHYRCEKCYYTEFIDSRQFGGIVGMVGKDLSDKKCPKCGELLIKDGFSIPCESFMGFELDREPDIDMNFAVEEQEVIKKHVLSLPGIGDACSAGTVGRLYGRTVDRIIKRYHDDSDSLMPSQSELEKMAEKISGVKTSDGLHPGGVIVVPKGEDLMSFTPITYKGFINKVHATHFDYHSIDSTLLKLDILGHDDPTMIKYMQTMTGVDPKNVDYLDDKVMSLFHGTRASGIIPDDIGGKTLGLLGIPEFGTEFVGEMIKQLKPTTLTQLIKISALSHGTGTWQGNAKRLIDTGKATLDECITCRDDIMQYLLDKGFDRATSYIIMENVRKGRGLTKEWQEEMRDRNIPVWYIKSCNKIKYLFPKAHAASYVWMALIIAWYKVYCPKEFYKASLMRYGIIGVDDDFPSQDVVIERINRYEGNNRLTDYGRRELYGLYVAREMYERKL